MVRLPYLLVLAVYQSRKQTENTQRLFIVPLLDRNQALEWGVMYQESRAYTTKTRPYTLCISTQKRILNGERIWQTVTEERHSFRNEHAIVKYLARNVIFQHSWILASFGQAVRPVDRDRRIVLWGFHQEPNSIMREELNVNPLVERARIIARNQ